MENDLSQRADDYRAEIAAMMTRIKPGTSFEYCAVYQILKPIRRLDIVSVTHAGVVTFVVEGETYHKRLAVLAQNMVDSQATPIAV